MNISKTKERNLRKIDSLSTRDLSFSTMSLDLQTKENKNFENLYKITNSYSFFKNSFTYEKKEKIFNLLFDSDLKLIESGDLKLFNLDEKFELIPYRSRVLVIGDLFEFDKCFYQKTYNVKIDSLSTDIEKSWQIIKTFQKIKEDYVLNIWKTEIIDKIKKNKSKTIKPKIRLNLTSRGFPNIYRHIIWQYLVKNDLKITKQLFQIYLKSAIELYSPHSLIKQDIDRTFTHFKKSQEFSLISKEAILLLHMFQIFRPDLKYVQGMCYIMVMILLFFPPYNAFKIFCNLIIGKSIMYKLFTFEEKYVNKINNIAENIVRINCRNLYDFLKINNLECWNLFWVEWMFSLFLKSFDLKICVVLWDLFLLEDEFVLIKLIWIVFGMIEKNVQSFRPDNFLDEVRKLLISKRELILSNLLKEGSVDIFIKDIEL